jgi:hypothetical protein
MREKYRLLREAAYEDGLRMFPKLVRTPTFRDFVTLYIAEGYKRSRNEVGICNSDPVVIKLANVWVCRFASNPVRYRVQFHADQELDGLAEFWAAELGVSPASVRLIRKSNSGELSGRTWRCRYGVLTISAADTYLRARLQAWIDCLQREWLDSLANGA